MVFSRETCGQRKRPIFRPTDLVCSMSCPVELPCSSLPLIWAIFLASSSLALRCSSAWLFTSWAAFRRSSTSFRAAAFSSSA